MTLQWSALRISVAEIKLPQEIPKKITQGAGKSQAFQAYCKSRPWWHTSSFAWSVLHQSSQKPCHLWRWKRHYIPRGHVFQPLEQAAPMQRCPHSSQNSGTYLLETGGKKQTNTTCWKIRSVYFIHLDEYDYCMILMHLDFISICYHFSGVYVLLGDGSSK